MSKYKQFALPRLCGAIGPLLAVALAGCASDAPSSRPLTAPASAPAPKPAMRQQPVETPPVVMREDAPLTYVVQPGDTLWDIANRFLLDPWQWPEVWIVNEQVANPHRIYPGDKLQLIYRDGRPQVALLTPQVRGTYVGDAIATIPVDAVRHFLRSPRLVDEDQLEAAPYVLAFDDGRLIGASGNEAYIRRLPASAAPLYAIVREGEPYIDPDDGEVLGIEAVQVGEAQITEAGDPAVSVIVKSEREALPGDRLLPIEPLAYEADFYPHVPTQTVGGRIIAVFDGVSQIGQYQVVALNRGSQHGLEAGHVLSILQVGEAVRDPLADGFGNEFVQLPSREAGSVLVFKVTPRLSYALVMDVSRPVHVLDRVENPASLG